MKIVAITCRIFLGLMFVVFGANGLHPFMHQTPPTAGTAVGDWLNIMMACQWLKVISALQLIGGILVLAGGTLPLGLVILCPITFNILLFHLCLTGGHAIGPGFFTAVLEIVLLYSYRANFAGVLTTKAKPV